MDTKILGLSGRKQSGKNTICNFLHGMKMVEIGLIENFRFSEAGELIVPTQTFDDDGNETVSYGEFNLERKDMDFSNFMSVNVWPFIKGYSFADMLKKNICIDVLGLSYEQCYGTDEEKNTDSNITWGDLPTPNTNVRSKNLTAREVMQYVGTDFFRKMYPDVWADATIRQIRNEGSAFAVVTDLRFPNEVEAIQNAGGKVLRLTRNSESDDTHSSETALDKGNFDWSNFDHIIDNNELTVQSANEMVYSVLMDWGMASLEYSKT